MPRLPGNLTVEQNLRVFGLFYEVPSLSERVEELLLRFDLARFRGTRAGVLSSGEQTRLSLAKALLNAPEAASSRRADRVDRSRHGA